MNKLILLFILFISCNQNHDFYPDDDAYATELFLFHSDESKSIGFATKNVPGKGSVEWKGNVFTSKASHLALDKSLWSLQLYTSSNYNTTWTRENIGFQYLPFKEGKIILNKRRPDDGREIPIVFYTRILADGDVFGRGWGPGNYKESFITLHKIDSINKKIHCSFDLYLEDKDEVITNLNLNFPNTKNIYLWSKNINFLGGHVVVDFPK